jgi:RNA polymerase sigma factor (sigma-70 family)
MPKEFPNDNEIINLLKESSENLDIVYEKHKDYCMNFMKGINNNDELNQDIYHEALIFFYEKITKPDFVLTCSIQTYLNSICRNHILVRFKKNSKHSEYSEDYDERIEDCFEEDTSVKDEKVQATIKGLEQLKELGGKCYEIIRKFFYDNHSMDKIAYDLGYTNADNAKNQKARCQKKLKEMVFELINK